MERDRPDQNGMAALHHACHWDQVRIVDLLQDSSSVGIKLRRCDYCATACRKPKQQRRHACSTLQ